MTDRELLELAAKAAGIKLYWDFGDPYESDDVGQLESWNPLEDDGDALRMAVQLNLNVFFDSHTDGVIVVALGTWDDAPDAVTETFEREGLSATRRAIVRAAAEIGRAM